MQVYNHCILCYRHGGKKSGKTFSQISILSKKKAKPQANANKKKQVEMPVYENMAAMKE